MKVLFVYPGIGVGGFRNNAASYIGKIAFNKKAQNHGEFCWIHHGVAMLVAVLKKAGHEVKLSDLRKHTGWMDYVKDLQDMRPDWVCISASYLDTQAAKKVALLAKQNFPSVKVVVGGLSPTLNPKLWEEDAHIDHVVIGEGEVVLPSIIDGSTSEKVVKGIKPDLNSLPFADRECFDYLYEIGCSMAPGQARPMVTMISARGCPFQCTYCQPAESMVFGKGTRFRSPDHVIAELKELREKYAFKSITWWDDTFTISKVWLKEFCEKYKAEGFDAEMVVCNRADIICRDEETVRMLAEVGVKWFIIGFETGTDRLLQFLKKGTSVETNLKAAKICKKYGIKIFGTFMLGLPTETNEDALRTYQMIRDIEPDHKMVFYFTPIPGTEIYKYCQDNQLMLRENELDIDRTSNYKPKIRGVDYHFLDEIRAKLTECQEVSNVA